MQNPRLTPFLKNKLDISIPDQISLPTSKLPISSKISDSINEELKQINDWQKEFNEIIENNKENDPSQEQTKKQNKRKSRNNSSRKNKSACLKRKSSVDKDEEQNQQKKKGLVSNQPLKKQKVYIEVYDGPNLKSQDLSHVFDDILTYLGATIMKRQTQQTTVLIWQYGSLKSLEKAKQFKTTFVNPCWIDQCAIENGIADFSQFPIIELNPKEKEEIHFRERKWFKQKKPSEEKPVDADEKAREERMQQKLDFFLPMIMVDISKQMELISKNIPDFWIKTKSCKSSKQQQQTQLFSINLSAIKEEKNEQELPQKLPKKKIILLKSISIDLQRNFSDLVLINEEYEICLEEKEKIDADFLVIPKEFRYDFYVCLFQIKQVQNNGFFINQQWIIDSVEDMEIKPYYDYIVKREKEEFSLNPFTFHIYFPRATTDEEKKQTKKMASKYEEIIQFYGGKTSKLEHADLCLVVKNLNRKQVASIQAKNSKTKIIRVQWIFESIQYKRITDFTEYRFN